MKNVLAHGRFCLMQHHYDLDGWSDVVSSPSHPQSPLVMTAAAQMSGGLEDLPDDCPDGELVEVAAHGASLISCGVLKKSDWVAGCVEIFAELEAAFLKSQPVGG